MLTGLPGVDLEIPQVQLESQMGHDDPLGEWEE